MYRLDLEDVQDDAIDEEREANQGAQEQAEDGNEYQDGAKDIASDVKRHFIQELSIALRQKCSLSTKSFGNQVLDTNADKEAQRYENDSQESRPHGSGY